MIKGVKQIRPVREVRRIIFNESGTIQMNKHLKLFIGPFLANFLHFQSILKILVAFHHPRHRY